MYLNNITSLLIDPQVIKGPLQPAAVLIQARRHTEAHRLLLNLSHEVMDDPNLWLLLAWTAPSPRAALEYYRACIKLNPQNDLARAGIRSALAYLRHGGNSQSEFEPHPISLPETIEKKNLSSKYSSISISPRSTLFVNQPTVADNPDNYSASYVSIFTQRLFHLSNVHFAWILIGYLIFVAIAELLTTFSIPQLGLGLHALLLVILFLHASLSRVKAQSRFIYTISLAPLIRILSLSMPLTGFQVSLWYVIIGLPLLLSAYVVFRLTGYQGKDIGLSSRKLPLQFLIGFIGFPLGWLEHQILKPEPLVQSWLLQDVLVTALILLVFTGFLEEFIFRGLMQRAADNIMPKYGLYWISILFAIMHIGYKSIIDFIFVLFVGLLFAFIVKRTNSIWGVTLAHGVINISLFILLPLLL